ncbi:MAG: hypothetical protein M1831_007490 [Alyxoria varia]|nr:MAG: hypothetical protein M1831_007490 [Alyxoria varia]
MCKFDHLVYDCACDDVVVPECAENRCANAVITKRRRYCKDYPNPRGSTPGIHLSPPKKNRGCCGKLGCLANTTRACLKGLKQLNKRYWILEELFRKIPYCRGRGYILSACEKQFSQYDVGDVTLLSFHTKLTIYEAFGPQPGLEDVYPAEDWDVHARGPALGVALLDTIDDLEKINKDTTVMKNLVFEKAVAEKLVLMGSKLEKFEAVLLIVEKALAQYFSWHNA